MPIFARSAVAHTYYILSFKDVIKSSQNIHYKFYYFRMYVSTSFFQLDMGPPAEVLGLLPHDLQHRFIIDFCCTGNVPWKIQTRLQNWMSTRWKEVPEDGMTAFFNRFLTHIKTQTVSLGESSSSISFKVKSQIY